MLNIADAFLINFACMCGFAQKFMAKVFVFEN